MSADPNHDPEIRRALADLGEGYVEVRGYWDAPLRPRASIYRTPSPVVAEALWLFSQAAFGGRPPELGTVELAVLCAQLLGSWEAAETLAKVLPLNLHKSMPLEDRAAAILLAIRDSKVESEETFRRLIPGQTPLLIEKEAHTVAYLPLVLPGEEMVWRNVPESLRGRPGLTPWDWSWNAFIWGYLIPAARAYAEELEEFRPGQATRLSLQALSLDKESDEREDKGEHRLEELIPSAANTQAEAFQNIAREKLLKKLEPRDRALWLIFVERGYQLRDITVRGISRNTLSQQISRVREEVRAIQEQIFDDFRVIFEAFEKIQGFGPLEHPRAPGNSQPWDHALGRPGLEVLHPRYPADELAKRRLKRLEARRNNRQALRGGSVDLAAPKLPSGRPVHPLLTPSELDALRKELLEAYPWDNPGHPVTCEKYPPMAERPRGGPVPPPLTADRLHRVKGPCPCWKCRRSEDPTKGDDDVSAIAERNELLRDIRNRIDALLVGLEDTVNVLVYKFPDHEDQIRDKASEIFEALRDD